MRCSPVMVGMWNGSENMADTQKGNESAKGADNNVDASLTRHGGLSYLEIPAVDARRSATFYEKVCGWKIEERAADDWRFSDPSGHLIGSWKIGRAISR